MSKKKWHETFYTYIWVFNTGRGLAICVRFPHNTGILFDLGASEDFSPIEFVAKHIAPMFTPYKASKIAQCFLSHPHADHLSEISRIIDRDDDKALLHPYLLTCPNDKAEGEEVNFKRFINDDNRDLIAQYRKSYEERKPPLQSLESDGKTYIPYVEYGFYYVHPPHVDKIHPDISQDYVNGLSLVFYLRHGKNSIVIPGDITPAVMKELLLGGKHISKRYTYFSNVPTNLPPDFHTKTSSQPPLKTLLEQRGLSVLVAPHHGLESGFTPELFDAIKGNKPYINIISEKRHLSETEGKVDRRYQSANCAIGVPVNIEGKTEERYSASTRNGQHILVILSGTVDQPYVFLRSDPEDLLSIT